ncbi:MAG: hypothetical protein AB3N18_09790 [Allomuricauda sp.]
MKSKIVFFYFLLALFSALDLVGQELHSQSNAASIANESNSLDGWTSGSSQTNLSVESNDVYHGSHAIRIEASADGWVRGLYSFSTTANTQYKIVIHAKMLSPLGGLWSWEGFSDFVGVDIEDAGWKRYELNLTASGTEALIKVYSGHPSVAGNAVLIDYVSIQELDSQSPTAPVLSEISHTNDLVNLSWTFATDNIGVTGYNVYRNSTLLATLSNVGVHQAAGLSSSTPYQFYVTALDYYGNESPPSNILTITTDASSGGEGQSSVWSESNSVASYNGDVAIGTITVPADYKMAIDGKLITEEVKVQLSGNWPDYVFDEDYDLPTLDEIQKHINEKGHLPNIPSAQEVEINGIELGEINKLLLEKIEELTLYVLQQNEINKSLAEEIEILKKTINEKP